MTYVQVPERNSTDYALKVKCSQWIIYDGQVQFCENLTDKTLQETFICLFRCTVCILISVWWQMGNEEKKPNVQNSYKM